MTNKIDNTLYVHCHMSIINISLLGDECNLDVNHKQLSQYTCLTLHWCTKHTDKFKKKS